MSASKSMIHFEIDRNDLAQIGDALRIRLESWQNTLGYFETGESETEIEECTDEGEAENMIREYQRLVDLVEGKLNETR